MRNALGVLVFTAAVLHSSCDMTPQCECERPGRLNVWPEQEQVLPVFGTVKVLVSASLNVVPGIVAVNLTSEPAGAFELDSFGTQPSEKDPLFISRREGLELTIRVASSHPLRAPATATLTLTTTHHEPITRTFRLEPPTPHLRFGLTPEGTGCAAPGETVDRRLTIKSVGSADVTISAIEGIDAAPGLSLVLEGREYPLDGVARVEPPLILPPAATADATLRFVSTQYQRADLWLRLHSDDPDVELHRYGVPFPFNLSCQPQYNLPGFDPVAVGDSQTVELVIEPNDGVSFFIFETISIDERNGHRPAEGFVIDPIDVPAPGPYHEALAIPLTFRPLREGLHDGTLWVCEQDSCTGRTISAMGVAQP